MGSGGLMEPTAESQRLPETEGVSLDAPLIPSRTGCPNWLLLPTSNQLTPETCHQDSLSQVVGSCTPLEILVWP